MPVIGVLHLGSPEANVSLMAAFRQGLAEAGYVEGRNVAIEFRWAHNDTARLPELAADLVRNRVAVIATPGSVASALAAKAAIRKRQFPYQSGSIQIIHQIMYFILTSVPIRSLCKCLRAPRTSSDH